MKDRGRGNAAAGRVTIANGLVVAQVVLSVVLAGLRRIVPAVVLDG